MFGNMTTKSVILTLNNNNKVSKINNLRKKEHSNRKRYEVKERDKFFLWINYIIHRYKRETLI